jgi:crotonobetainyl-CoA:carnitine CoA-transferase CaiB-like acyl-CoA transferase
MRKGPLDGLKVVEVGNYISAAYCGKLLADYGAEVIKVELPFLGDESRHHGPFPDDVPHPERSGLHLYLNTNKYGVTLDFSVPTGYKILIDLLKEADVFVENYPPKYMEKVGLSYPEVEKHNRRLVMTSITVFGQAGPYRDYKGYDLNCLAAGGISHGEGYPHREPLTLPLAQGSYLGGLCGAIGTLLALFARDLTNEGQHVDIASAECCATFLAGLAIQSFVSEGRIKQRAGHRIPLRPYLDTVLPCKDGYVILDTPQRRQWQRFLSVLGDPDWAKDPRFEQGLGIMDEYGDEIEANLAPWLMAYTKEEIFAICRQHQIPGAPINDIDEVVHSNHLKARGYFVEVERREVGTLRYPGAPVMFSKTPWSVRMPAPLLGEHNKLIYCERLGYSRAELSRLRQAGVI